MGLEITPDVEETVKSILQSGQYDSESAVLREALSLLRLRDELCGDIQAGIAELDRGERIPGDEVFRELEEKMAQMTESPT